MINGMDELLTALNSEIIRLKNENEKLKCCSNCKYSLPMSEAGLNKITPCGQCQNESLWEISEHL